MRLVQTMNGLPPGLSRPFRPIILGHSAPRAESRRVRQCRRAFTASARQPASEKRHRGTREYPSPSHDHHRVMLLITHVLSGVRSPRQILHIDPRTYAEHDAPLDFAPRAIGGCRPR